MWKQSSGPSKDVRISILQDQASDKQRNEARDEAITLSSFFHRNVVQLFGVVDHDDKVKESQSFCTKWQADKMLSTIASSDAIKTVAIGNQFPLNVRSFNFYMLLQKSRCHSCLCFLLQFMLVLERLEQSLRRHVESMDRSDK